MEDKYTMTKDGVLFRNNKKQYCPFQQRENANCGNWCPLFETIGALFSDTTESVILHCGGSRIIKLSGE